MQAQTVNHCQKMENFVQKKQCLEETEIYDQLDLISPILMSTKKKGHGNTVTPKDSKQIVPSNNSNQEI